MRKESLRGSAGQRQKHNSACLWVLVFPGGGVPAAEWL